MFKPVTLIVITGLLSACSQGIEPTNDRTTKPCRADTHCVSTADSSEKVHLAPFILRPGVTLEQGERVVLTLPGTRIADRNKDSDYVRIECTSKILRFVDDLELRLSDFQLIVRSQSRSEYPDFGSNRRRVEELREKLSLGGMLETP